MKESFYLLLTTAAILGSLNAFANESKECEQIHKNQVRAPNLVLTPEYLEPEDVEQPDQDQPKLQYMPSESDLPLLQENQNQEEVTNGAKYETGIELSLDSKSGYILKDEPVVDESEAFPTQDLPLLVNK